MIIRTDRIMIIIKSWLLFDLTYKIIKFLKIMEKVIRQKRVNEEIDELQNDLILLVKRMHRGKKICFTSVPYRGVPGGNHWRPAEDIKGDYVFESLGHDSDGVVKISKKISTDYQKVALEYVTSSERNDNLLEDGKSWLFGVLLKWSGSIVEKGLMSHKEVVKLTEAFEEVIQKRGEDFFGYVHGNIIGDHIYVGENKTLYLLGMRVISRPGRGYYDFLRALDWIILKTDSKKINFDRILSWMKKHLSEYDWEEVKLVFALRCIGILGWDMLYREDYGKGDFETKKDLLLKFIRRDY